ncbi:MAG TPA: tRNA (adenosine(37)-N6)-threonylcarbamoyltransferase complex ATPase subunit type 1 TsaE [Elusimicrobiales bacterium]|nr:tRNA (adenosine(37)-N6)-threonylcarbamoyltransferase complex ATPase subunit type 1 TsaE [Elusimicrobiales bacterium]
MSLAKTKHFYTFKIRNVKDTHRLAKITAENLKGGELIFLYGPIGSGKTTFVQGLAKAMGIKTSPTSASFNLMRIYRGKKISLVHVDLFRLKQCEVHNLGLDEVLQDDNSVVVAEWPDAIKNYLPQEKIKINIKLSSGDGRRFNCVSVGEKHTQLLKKIKFNYEK